MHESDRNQLAGWEVMDRSIEYDARPWVRVWRETVQVSDDLVIDDFITLEMPDHVVVVAVTETGYVIVSRNYKHGPRRQCINLPGGYIVDHNEDPEQAARRELLEETGYAGGEWITLGSFASDGNRGAGTSHMFLATGVREAAQPVNVGDLEEMSIKLMRLDVLLSAVDTGEVGVLSNAAAIALAGVRRQS